MKIVDMLGLFIYLFFRLKKKKKHLYFSRGSHWVESSMAISSPRHGVCLYTDIGGQKRGNHLAKMSLCPHLTRYYYELYSH